MTGRSWGFPCISNLVSLLVLGICGHWGGANASHASDGPVEPGREPGRPNFLVILADDLGYSDIGCYGGEIQTPHLDSLAAHGLRYTQFYNTARCWPTRAALLTGYYAQQVRRDTVPHVKSGSQGSRPAWATLLPQTLRSNHYLCYHSGKWHVDGTPLSNGFDRSYWLEDCGRNFHPRVHSRDDIRLPAVEPGTGYYSTAFITDEAISQLKLHHQQPGDRSFFQFVAYVAPHFPLHALPEDIAKYRDTYRVGWDVIREQRWEKMQKLGLVSGEISHVEYGIGPPYPFPEAIAKYGPHEVNRPIPWSDLTPEQQEFQATKMAIHAAMVDRIDQEIGRLLQQLRDMNAWDDTVVLFLSDNGCSAEMMVRDDGHDPTAPAGSAATHLCLGPGWSTVSNSPFRRHKTWVHEGGIATPLIVHSPKLVKDQGELRHTPGHVIDLWPTVTHLAGVNEVDTQAIAPTRPGKRLSFENPSVTEARELWWAHEGNRAIRRGDWKLVASREQPWELYRLTSDRAEQHDLAGQFPDVVRELSSRWEELWTTYGDQARAE